MQFLRTAFWVILAVAIALFCKANNRPLDIKIWGDIMWDTQIWFAMLISFLMGAIPFWILSRATRWRLLRRIENAERALANATASQAIVTVDNDHSSLATSTASATTPAIETTTTVSPPSSAGPL